LAGGGQCWRKRGEGATCNRCNGCCPAGRVRSLPGLPGASLAGGSSTAARGGEGTTHSAACRQPVTTQWESVPPLAHHLQQPGRVPHCHPRTTCLQMSGKPWLRGTTNASSNNPGFWNSSSPANNRLHPTSSLITTYRTYLSNLKDLVMFPGIRAKCSRSPYLSQSINAIAIRQFCQNPRPARRRSRA
jgi:hypothetical protein